MATVSDITTDVRTTLQDVSKKRWTDAEMNYYINEGLQDIAIQTMNTIQEDTLSVVEGTTDYDLTYKAIKFLEIDTDQDFTYDSNETLSFTDPTDETVSVKYYAYPDTVSIAADNTLILDNDLVLALRYFVLKRCYEKEDSTENFQKAMYFENEYQKQLDKNMTRWHGLTEVTMAKGDYYTG